MLSEKLRQYRKAKGWTQDDLALRSGFSRSSIINWESGKRAPRAIDIDKLAITLEVSPSALFSNEQKSEDAVIPKDAWLLPAGLGQGTAKEQHKLGVFAYWGGVLDMALKLAESKDVQEISLIMPFLKRAYDALRNVIEQGQTELQGVPATVSAYNGNNSKYIGNTFDAGKLQ